MSLRILLVGVGLVCMCAAHAQILKVDKHHLTSDSSGYFIGVIDGSIAVNNRSSTLEKQNIYVGFRNNLDLVRIGDRSAILLMGGINYFKIGEGPLISNGTGHLRHIVQRKAKLTPEFFAQLQYDQSRNMQNRELLGGGMRWNILRGKNSLSAGIGAFHEHERWMAGEEILMNLVKMNSYLSGQVNLSERIQVNTIFYLQTGYDGSIDSYRSRLSGHFEIKDAVSKHIRVKFSTDVLLDDKPIIPLNRLIYESYFGVEYRFN